MESKKIVKGDKKTIRGWVFYDWANSVYNLVVSSAIFPIFYDTITKQRYADKIGVKVEDLKVGQTILVDFFGAQLSSSVLFSFVLATSFIVVACLSPLLSGVADYTGSKKKFKFYLIYY